LGTLCNVWLFTETTEVHRHCLFWGLCATSDYLQKQLKFTGTVFFGDFVQRLIVYRIETFQKPAVSVFRQRSTRCNP
jgi:hypothetical protein